MQIPGLCEIKAIYGEVPIYPQGEIYTDDDGTERTVRSTTPSIIFRGRILTSIKSEFKKLQKDKK